MEEGEGSFTSKMVSKKKTEQLLKGVPFVSLVDSPPKVKKDVDDWDPDFDFEEKVFEEKDQSQEQMAKVLKSIDDFKQNMMSLLSKPAASDVNLAKNVVDTLVENLVTPLTKESHRPKPKERVKKIYSPYSKRCIDVTSTPTGCYIKSNKKLVGPFIPDWLSSLFKPKKTMKLNLDQCDMASYIFGHSADDKPVVRYPRVPFCDGTMKHLNCLKPTQMLTGDVIDLVACMMTDKAKEGVINKGFWFMPTVFSQYVMIWNATIPCMIKKYKNDFMGDLGTISKVFIPVHDADHLHWFLLVIDLKKKEVIYLDSLPSHSSRRGRMRSIKKLTVYMEELLEELLMDPAFHVSGTADTPNVSEFALVTPNDLGMQADMSNDCGVWVITWMKQMGENGYKIDVDDGTRLRIALDLILDPSNELKDYALAAAKKRRVEECNKI